MDTYSFFSLYESLDFSAIIKCCFFNFHPFSLEFLSFFLKFYFRKSRYSMCERRAVAVDGNEVIVVK